MTRAFFHLMLAIGLWGIATAATATPDGPVEARLRAFDRAQAAVVGLQVSAIEDAPSNLVLGQERMGSGVVIGADGLTLTVGYLIQEAQTIDLTTADHRSVPARSVAFDPATGLGLVRPLLPLPGIRPVRLASSADVAPGELLQVMTGAAEDEDGDILPTQLVSKRAFAGSWEYLIESGLYTAPPVEPHAGAALFTPSGELLGIGCLLLLDVTGSSHPVPGNLFIPVDLLKPVLDELQRDGSSRQSHRPWLGLISSEAAGRIDILRVTRGSPADNAGLQPGDVVLAVDGNSVSTLAGFYRQLWAHDPGPAGARIELKVLQGAEVRTLQLETADRLQSLLKPEGI
ncbi:MAG: serine protease [Curvibacter sp.]|nr:serine protease [Curvibacter sp.]